MSALWYAQAYAPSDVQIVSPIDDPSSGTLLDAHSVAQADAPSSSSVATSTRSADGPWTAPGWASWRSCRQSRRRQWWPLWWWKHWMSCPSPAQRRNHSRPTDKGSWASTARVILCLCRRIGSEVEAAGTSEASVCRLAVGLG